MPRTSVLIRPLFGLLGGLAAALICGPLLALASATVAQHVYGPFEKLAYMRSGMTGGGLGLALGIVGGAWLVLRDQGRTAGPMLAWLWVGAFIVLLCLGWVAAQ
jgi:hypothetical protein